MTVNPTALSTARFEFAVHERQVAQRVEKFRVSSGMSERAFCDAVGVNRQTWRRILEGDAVLRLAYVYSAAALFEVQPSTFI